MRSWRRDDRAISTVVGAMLIFAIGVSITASIRAAYVPTWESDAEGAHMRLLGQQLVEMRADLQRQVELDSASVLAHTLTMGRQRVGVFDSGQSADRIALSYPAQGITIRSPAVLVEDPAAGASEVWTPASSSSALDNVKSLNSMRLRLDTLQKALDGAFIDVCVVDANNQPHGQISVDVSDESGTDYYVEIRTYDDCGRPLPASNLVNQEIRAYHNGDSFTSYFVDLLSPYLRFNRVVESAPVPFRLDFTMSAGPAGWAVDYALQYIAYTSGGPGLPLGGGGAPVADYERTFSGGVLVYDATNRHYPAQVYRLEHGALLLEQPQGQVFRAAPAVRADLVNGITGIVADLPTLSGDARTVSGRGAVVLHSSFVDGADVSLHAAQLRLVVQSGAPQLWADHFAATLTAAGLSSTTNPFPEYSLAVGANTMTLDLFGKLPDPANPSNDVRLLMRQSTVGIEIEP